MGAWNGTLPFTAAKQAGTVDRLNSGKVGAIDLHDNYFPTQVFRGLRMGQSRDGLGQQKVTLFSADEIVMHDGYRLGGWQNLSADITVAGAGGLDTGGETVSTWYEVHAISKDDNTKSLMLHKGRTQLGVGNGPTVAAVKLRDTAANTKLAQGFQVTSASPIWFIDIILAQVGTVSGGLSAMWLTVEADSAGSPSGTPLTTSDKVGANLTPAAAGAIRFYFRDGWTPAVSTQYHFVLQGDYTISAVNYMQMYGDTANSYPNGVAKIFNGTTWSASGTVLDFAFTAVVSVETAPVLPSGYTRRCRVGFVFNDAGGNLLFFYQVDRKVHTGQVGQGTFTATVPLLFSVFTAIPPVPVMADFGIGNSTAGNTVQAIPSDNPFTSGLVAHAMPATVSNSAVLSGMLTMFVEGQAVYVLTSAGTGQIWSNSYQW